MNWQERIIMNPEVLVGKPIIKDTRMSVEFILELLSNEWSYEEILEQYPHITKDDILACVSYARDIISNEDIVLTAQHS